MIRFIDEYRNRFSARVHLYDVEEQSRRWLYYLAWLSPVQSSWAKRSSPSRYTVLVERISAVHQANYGVYGVRKMWHALRREGIDIGREHTARLMRLAGVSGKGKGRSPITTRSPQYA